MNAILERDGRCSPPLLHAAGHRRTRAGFETLGIRPGLMAGTTELAGGFSLAARPRSPPSS